MKQKLFGELLLNSNYINEECLENALSIQKTLDKKHYKPIGEICVDQGYITEDDVIKTLAIQFNLKTILKITDDKIDTALMKKLPRSNLKNMGCVPLKIDGKTLQVSVSNPFKINELDPLRVLFGKELQIFLTSAKEINRVIDTFYLAEISDTKDIIEEIKKDNEFDHIDIDKDILDISSAPPIIQLVNNIISTAAQENASDIHIIPEAKSVVVKFRIDGVLYERYNPPVEKHTAIVSRIKVMSRLDLSETRLPQDGRIDIKVAGKFIDLRVSTLPTVFGERVVLRLLYKDIRFLNLDNLGFDKNTLKKYKNLILQPYGIILVTGPTGSGKSTTLYSSLNSMDKDKKNIITIEDPVEYRINGISQIEVKPSIELTFSRGLRHILRQDPDIILVGEIRDSETAIISVQASLTGHLVLSTLHTNDTISSITRLRDIGVKSYLIGSSIIGVLAQRLVRILCPNCKKGIPLTEEIKEVMENNDIDIKSIDNIYESVGCEKCFYTGYAGRTAVYELLIIDDNIKNMIINDTSTIDIKKYCSENQGMKFLFQNGLYKVAEGVTTIDEVYRIVEYRE